MPTSSHAANIYPTTYSAWKSDSKSTANAAANLVVATPTATGGGCGGGSAGGAGGTGGIPVAARPDFDAALGWNITCLVSFAVKLLQHQ
jgi:hypothetical protein